jgi:biotin carboxyl carrier protein
MNRSISDAIDVDPIGPGVYRVTMNGRVHVVYVAGSPGAQWAFCDGHLYVGLLEASGRAAPHRLGREGQQALVAPMPATVRKVLVELGAHVAKGEPLVILEAMKMELPLRAPSDGIVRAIHCRAGELVQPDAVLIQLDTHV